MSPASTRPCHARRNRMSALRQGAHPAHTSKNSQLAASCQCATNVDKYVSSTLLFIGTYADHDKLDPAQSILSCTGLDIRRSASVIDQVTDVEGSITGNNRIFSGVKDVPMLVLGLTHLRLAGV